MDRCRCSSLYSREHCGPDICRPLNVDIQNAMDIYYSVRFLPNISNIGLPKYLSTAEMQSPILLLMHITGNADVY